MLSLPGETRVFMCIDPIDLRKGFEGLTHLVESLFPNRLLTGAYFAFLNRTGDKIKILYWDMDGLVIWCKRLEKGTFSRKLAKQEMNRRDFFLLLEGITPRRIAGRFSVK